MANPAKAYRDTGGQPGDAYVIVRTQAEPGLTRNGAYLWHDLCVPVADAVLGTTARIHGVDGNVQIRVPPGTQPGAVLAVSGRGLPRYGGHGRGDLNATVTVGIPVTLSQRERELYQQLREAGPGTSRWRRAPAGNQLQLAQVIGVAFCVLGGLAFLASLAQLPIRAFRQWSPCLVAGGSADSRVSLEQRADRPGPGRLVSSQRCNIATRPRFPDAQQEPSRAQLTVSNWPVSKVCQSRPPS